ncbi:MAG: ankyrin repeat domain-containing protein, partial [Chitinophagaceae bacterium]
LQYGAAIDTKSTDSETLLHKAVKGKHIKRVEFLLSHSSIVNEKNKRGETPLHIAARSGEAEIVSLLLNHKADLHIKDQTGKTAFHLAVQKSDLPVVSAFIHLLNAADINATDDNLMTPLHLAAEKGSKAVVDLLIANGALTGARSKNDWTAIHIAAQNGHADVIEYLLLNGADKEAVSGNPYLTPLQLAAETGHTEAIKVLLKNGAALDRETPSRPNPFLLSLKNREYAAALFLLEAGADIDAVTKDGKNAFSFLFLAYRLYFFTPGEAETEVWLFLKRLIETIAQAVEQEFIIPETIDYSILMFFAGDAVYENIPFTPTGKTPGAYGEMIQFGFTADKLLVLICDSNFFSGITYCRYNEEENILTLMVASESGKPAKIKYKIEDEHYMLITYYPCLTLLCKENDQWTGRDVDMKTS